MLLRPFREARYKLPSRDIGSYEHDLKEEDAVDFANEAQPVGLFALLYGTFDTSDRGNVGISSNNDGWADAFLHLLLLQVYINTGLTHLLGWLLGQFEVWRAVVAAVLVDFIGLDLNQFYHFYDFRLFLTFNFVTVLLSWLAYICFFSDLIDVN